MSRAKETFAQSIKDAENLLKHFNDLNKVSPPAPELEGLKRAGLVMAMTAWETYVEDRVLEACAKRLRDLSDSSVAEFVRTLQIIGSGMGVISALSRKGWIIT